MQENMHTSIPLTDKPNIALKHEYRAPWITSQSGVESKTNLIPETQDFPNELLFLIVVDRFLANMAS